MIKHDELQPLSMTALTRVVGGAAKPDAETARETRRAYHKPVPWMDNLPKGKKGGGIEFDNPTVDVSNVDDRRPAECIRTGRC